MTKQDFISLLKKYEDKAQNALNDEAKAVALSLIPNDILIDLDNLNAMQASVREFWDTVRINSLGTLAHEAVKGYDNYYTSILHGTYPYRTDFRDSALHLVSMAVRATPEFRAKSLMIKNQFDMVISKAKKTTSVKTLTELAEMIGIPMGEEGIVLYKEPPTNSLDVTFLQTQIKAVKALT